MKWFPTTRPAEPWLAGFVVSQNGTLASLASQDGGAPGKSPGRGTASLPDEPAARRRATGLHAVTFGFVANAAQSLRFLADGSRMLASEPTRALSNLGHVKICSQSLHLLKHRASCAPVLHTSISYALLRHAIIIIISSRHDGAGTRSARRWSCSSHSKATAGAPSNQMPKPQSERKLRVPPQSSLIHRNPALASASLSLLRRRTWAKRPGRHHFAHASERLAHFDGHACS